MNIEARNGPRLLILDEPTSALDPEMTAEVLEMIEELSRGGQRIVLSTHEKTERPASGLRNDGLSCLKNTVAVVSS